MIIEWIINAIITLIKLPLQLLNIPTLNIDSFFDTIQSAINRNSTMIFSWIRFFLDDVAVTVLGVTITVLALFKVIDIVATIVTFFKSKGGKND